MGWLRRHAQVLVLQRRGAGRRQRHGRRLRRQDGGCRRCCCRLGRRRLRCRHRLRCLALQGLGFVFVAQASAGHQRLERAVAQPAGAAGVAQDGVLRRALAPLRALKRVLTLCGVEGRGQADC